MVFYYNRGKGKYSQDEKIYPEQVFCDQCHRHDRWLLEARSFEEIAEWNRRLCRTVGCEPPPLTLGEPPPPPGPLDFLEEAKLLMAEADH